jgi:peptide/nickel transport system permease protein
MTRDATISESPSGPSSAGAVMPRLKTFLAACRRNPLTTTGGVILVLLILAAILAPLITPYPADAHLAIHPAEGFEAPSAAHWFGTDQLGRDILTRVVFGARASLLIIAIVIASALLVGVPLGLCAGYFGGFLDELIMRVTDVFLAFPALLLSLALVITLSPSVTHATIAIAVTWWPWYARTARGQAVSLKRRPYVEACRVIGVSNRRIILRHILPNAFAPIIVQASLDAGGVLLVAASLSFLGLGAQEPTPEWGLMISQGREYFMTDWWIVTFPGIAILVAAMALNLIGDGLRDRLDPNAVAL